MTCVLIDPGHGGPKSDGVTVGSFREDDWALDVAGRLVSLLSDEFETHLTRTLDVPVSFAQRAAVEKSIDPQLVVSIHVNSNPSAKICGGAGYFWPGSRIGKSMASAFGAALPAELRGTAQRVVEATDAPGPDDDWKRRARVVLGAFKAPCLLAECGMASNAFDLAYLTTDEGKHAVACALEAAIIAGAKALKGVD